MFITPFITLKTFYKSGSMVGNTALLVGLSFGLSTILMSRCSRFKTIGSIAIKFCIDIHSPKRIDPNDFGDSSTFPLAPP